MEQNGFDTNRVTLYLSDFDEELHSELIINKEQLNKFGREAITDEITTACLNMEITEMVKELENAGFNKVRIRGGMDKNSPNGKIKQPYIWEITYE